jgi:NAD(P) transhydrogenase subunit alpha
MFSNNVSNLLEHFWDKENKTFRLNLEDEILKHSVLTHNGNIVNETIAQKVE